MICLTLAIKESLKFRLSGNDKVVSSVASQMYKILKLLAKRKRYSLNMEGYKEGKFALSMQVYISIANPEKLRCSRERTTHRIILKSDEILELAKQFVKDKKHEEKVGIRIEGCSRLSADMQKFAYVILKDYRKAKNQLKLRDPQKYKNKKNEIMDISIYC
jgi:hypothetical protein